LALLLRLPQQLRANTFQILRFKKSLEDFLILVLMVENQKAEERKVEFFLLTIFLFSANAWLINGF